MLKRLLAPLAALALLSGCAGLLNGPGEVADTTITDERVALGVETLYQGWVASVETGVDLGLIKGQLAARMQDYDRRIYTSVLLARRAYDAGNSSSYAVAVAEVASLISQAMSLVRGED